jgi:arginyl-tRNA synthetase
MAIAEKLKLATSNALMALYQQEVHAADILVNQTKPEFEGAYTVVLFAFVKLLKKSPDELGKEIGDWLLLNEPNLYTNYNVIKGFLNITIADTYWLQFLNEAHANKAFGKRPANGQKMMLEYSSPNTNKPLHLGHLRNNFLGWSVAEIFKAQGYDVIKSCIVNDRGVHICKSMIAWQLYANGATPQSTNTKGDHFVGEYYVKFNDAYKNEVSEMVEKGVDKLVAEKEAPIMLATQQMLLDWENGKPDVMELWRKMNGWVYQGFDVTYKNIGSDFDKTYYESNTYLLGKEAVKVGLEKKVFFTKADGSVWIDLTADGLDEKLVMRKDGTSVYITQDIGLAMQKHQEFAMNKSVYVIGDEQNYHMKVLQLICKKLAVAHADGIYHLSYGMVELPTGRMKSREGTVVDADDLVAEMQQVAQQKTEELGKVNGFTEAALQQLYTTLGMGALKFYLLRVDPKKKMIFNPEESIDFHGFTGPFVQYTHARIKSALKKVGDLPAMATAASPLLKLEKDLLILLEQYPTIITQAATEMNPSIIAIYVFELAKIFNSFYTVHSINNAETDEKKKVRTMLAHNTANVIASGMHLLGIAVPDRM